MVNVIIEACFRLLGRTEDRMGNILIAWDKGLRKHDLRMKLREICKKKKFLCSFDEKPVKGHFLIEGSQCKTRQISKMCQTRDQYVVRRTGLAQKLGTHSGRLIRLAWW